MTGLPGTGGTMVYTNPVTDIRGFCVPNGIAPRCPNETIHLIVAAAPKGDCWLKGNDEIPEDA